MPQKALYNNRRYFSEMRSLGADVVRFYRGLFSMRPGTFVLQRRRYVPDRAKPAMLHRNCDYRDAVMRCATILCIDDEPTGLVLRKMLLEDEGYEILVASSGHDGLNILQSSQVEAVVLDYRMPQMSGAEVARQIRKHWPHIPIILLSGYPQDLPKDMLSQVNAFVWKGGDPSELLTAIRSVLNGQALVGTKSVTVESPERLSKQSRAGT